jgi:hypothetical protein
MRWAVAVITAVALVACSDAGDLSKLRSENEALHAENEALRSQAAATTITFLPTTTVAPTTTVGPRWVLVYQARGSGTSSSPPFQMTTGTGRVTLTNSVNSAGDSVYWYVYDRGATANEAAEARGNCSEGCSPYVDYFNVPPGGYFVKVAGNNWSVKIEEER